MPVICIPSCRSFYNLGSSSIFISLGKPATPIKRSTVKAPFSRHPWKVSIGRVGLLWEGENDPCKQPPAYKGWVATYRSLHSSNETLPLISIYDKINMHVTISNCMNCKINTNSVWQTVVSEVH